MKFLFVITTLLVSAASFAATDVNSLLEKVNNEINKIELIQDRTKVDNSSVTLESLDQKEAAFWGSVVGAYEYLKSYYMSERYYFMFEAMKNASLGHPARVPALKAWIAKANQKIQTSNVHPDFFVKWNKHIAHITKSLNELSGTRNVSSSNNAAKAYYETLREIKYDLEAIRVAKPRFETKITPAVEVERIEMTTPLSDSQEAVYLTLLGICVAVIGLSFFKSSKEDKKVTRIIKREALLKQDIIAEASVAAIPSLPPEALFTGVSLEDKCREVLAANTHLFSAAELQVLNAQRSSFRTTVNAPAANVDEALNWLLKGTMAVANTSSSKASHMEWNCKENAGRVYLEFVLHGVECDEKNLYMNTLIDGNGSAPAHFGRSEMALDGHYPSVAFKSGNKKTTVSLGLDALSHGMNH